jgi:hypothetical protein
VLCVRDRERDILYTRDKEIKKERKREKKRSEVEFEQG